jgi:hypothetical protein
MKDKIVIVILAAFGGAVLMSMELIFPKVSMIWFGNLLNVWSANLVMALMTIAIGYYVGAKLVERVKVNMLPYIYGVVGIWFVFLPIVSEFLMSSMLLLNESIGSLLSAFLLMMPSIGLLAMTSPILVNEMSTRSESKSSVSIVFSTSTFAGVAMIFLVGLYLLPNFGIVITSYVSAGIMLVSAVLSFLIRPIK